MMKIDTSVAERSLSCLPVMLCVLSLMLPACEKSLPEDRLPGRGRVMVRMTQWQEPWFARKIENWPGRGEVELHVESYQFIQDVVRVLEEAPSKAAGPVLLVKIEGRMLPAAVRKGQLLPLERIAGDDRSWKEAFDERALAPAVIDGKTWALPRKIENHIFMYSKKEVLAASKYWASMRDELESIFRFENGRGLPEGYRLESDPSCWDFFDLAVAGYYWSHSNTGGKRLPRLGHRTKNYPGTLVDMACRVFALGGNPVDLLHCRGKALADFLTWEAFFFRYGLYPKEMIDPGWFGVDMYSAFREGRLLACSLHQVDAFHFMDELDKRGASGTYGFTGMIRGASMELDEKSGSPERTGRRVSHLAGWWWAVPASCPCPRYSLSLAGYITSRDFQLEECARFGNFPVRKDILDSLASAFPEAWKRRIFEVTERQFDRGCPRMFDDRLTHADAGKKLLELWHRVITDPRLYDRSIPISKLGIAETAASFSE